MLFQGTLYIVLIFFALRIQCLLLPGQRYYEVKELLEYSQKSSEVYMDMILEEFAQLNNPNVVRYDL